MHRRSSDPRPLMAGVLLSLRGIMGWAEAFMVIAVLITSAWLARRVSTAAAIALWTSAFLISAGMFLPSATLGGLLGPTLLVTLTSAIASWPWAIGTVAHFISFLWLALVLWILRPDVRGWHPRADLRRQPGGEGRSG